jgi:hypothetical protein
MAHFEERTALECQFLSERGIPWHEVKSYNYQQKHELQLRYLGWLLQKVDKYKNELRQLEAALSPAAGVYQPLIESDGSIGARAKIISASFVIRQHNRSVLHTSH